jgi:hypothetical protein
VNAVNLGPRESRKRLVFGFAMLALGAGLIAALEVLHAGRTWRLVLFLPFWLAALGLIEAREKT